MSVKTVSSQADAANPLGYEKEGKLLVGFAIPCIIFYNKNDILS